MAQSGWADERVMSLKALYEKGLSCSQIADEMGGVSRNAVIGKLSRLGLSRPQPPRPVKIKDPARKTRFIRPGFRPAASKPQPFYATDADIPLHQRRALLDLEPHHCRFPVGEPGTVGFFFCGGQADLPNKRPYCPFHESVAYTKPSAHVIDIHTRMRLAKRQAEQEIRARACA